MAHRILIIDDERELCDLVAMDLEAEGFEVTTKYSGNQAIAELEAHPAFDLILSDVRMADGDGVALLNFVQTMSEPRPPILMISGFSDINEAQIISKGGRGLLSKPIDFDVLIERINKEIASK